MTATITNTIPDEISIDEIATSTKFTATQASVIYDHNGPEITVITRSGYVAWTSTRAIEELRNWSETADLSAKEKSAIKRAIAKMEEELRNEAHKLNFTRRQEIQKLKHAAAWTDEINVGTKVEMYNDRLTVRLVDLNRPEMVAYGYGDLDSATIGAEVGITEDGKTYTKYHDTADWSRSWSVANTLEQAIEESKTRMIERHVRNTSEATRRRQAAQEALTTLGIEW
jgi:hypothetical protein